MRRNKHIPAHFGTNAARQAQTRYLRGKTPESERVEKPGGGGPCDLFVLHGCAA